MNICSALRPFTPCNLKIETFLSPATRIGIQAPGLPWSPSDGASLASRDPPVLVFFRVFTPRTQEEAGISKWRTLDYSPLPRHRGTLISGHLGTWRLESWTPASWSTFVYLIYSLANHHHFVPAMHKSRDTSSFWQPTKTSPAVPPPCRRPTRCPPSSFRAVCQKRTSASANFQFGRGSTPPPPRSS